MLELRCSGSPPRSCWPQEHSSCVLEGTTKTQADRCLGVCAGAACLRRHRPAGATCWHKASPVHLQDLQYLPQFLPPLGHVPASSNLKPAAVFILPQQQTLPADSDFTITQNQGDSLTQTSAAAHTIVEGLITIINILSWISLGASGPLIEPGTTNYLQFRSKGL